MISQFIRLRIDKQLSTLPKAQVGDKAAEYIEVGDQYMTLKLNSGFLFLFANHTTLSVENTEGFIFQACG